MKHDINLFDKVDGGGYNDCNDKLLGEKRYNEIENNNDICIICGTSGICC